MQMQDKEYYKDYYQKHKERKFETNEIWRKNNPDKAHASARKSARSQRIKIKKEIVQLLGGKCSNPNCAVIGGMSDIRCLQIDHIHGGGKQQRRKYKGHQDRGSHYYRDILVKIKGGSKEFQLLCANCNWIKRCENGETGSKWGRKVVDVGVRKTTSSD